MPEDTPPQQPKQTPILCLECQRIDAQIKQSMGLLHNCMIHIELTCRCDKCGKFIFTGRMYNPSVVVLQTAPQKPTITVQ